MTRLVYFLKNDIDTWCNCNLLNFEFFLHEGEMLFKDDFASYIELKCFIESFREAFRNIINLPDSVNLKRFRRCIRECFFLRNGVWCFYPVFSYVKFKNKSVISSVENDNSVTLSNDNSDDIVGVIWPEYALFIQ